MPQPFEIDDYASSLFDGLSGFWQRFFRDTNDLHAFYRASEQYLGQVYLDLLGSVLSTGINDTPIFNKEYWKLFLIQERDLSFVEGAYESEDRYRYDMPGTAVSLVLLQNSIFNPSVTYEKDIDFDLKDDDGYVYFRRDIFNEVFDADTGDMSPLSGVARRLTEITVGNSLTDAALPVGSHWESATSVKKGDTLNILAYRGAFIQEGIGGQISATGNVSFVAAAGAAFDDTNVGDIIEVYESSTGDYVGYYLILNTHDTDPKTVYLDATFNLPTVTSSPDLKWKHYKAIYFNTTDETYEIDYFDKEKIVGNYDTPLPLQYQYPLVYAVIRDIADNKEPGVNLSNAASTPQALLLDRTLVMKPGTLVVNALRVDGSPVVEGIDFVVDYDRAFLTVLPYTGGIPGTDPCWDPASVVHVCSFEYRKQVFLSAGGRTNELAYNYVRELSLWVPEVMVDRYTLYNNYGYLLNRFAASSETYKAFLRGIMYLYVSGPKLYVVESALNVAAGYPVVTADGEVFSNYDSGVNATGTDGVFVSGDHYMFSSATAAFTSDDLGAWLVIDSSSNEANKGKFKIIEVVDANTLEVEAEYPVVDETGMDWTMSWTYQKTITTRTTGGDIRYYKYPLNVPLRSDLLDPSNYSKLTFEAFEILTSAFQVTDYIEDPQWWHDKYIPGILWPNTTADRRFATTMLYRNIIDPDDDARIDDPGLFMDADDQGIVVAPTKGLGTDPADIYRHGAAFCIMDQFLKFHMFFVDVDPAVDLSAQFRDDMANLVLIVKPSYTYPYVETGDVFIDNLTLWDTLRTEFGFEFALDGIQIADCDLKMDQAYSMGDYYRYKFYNGSSQSLASPPAAPFTLAVTPGEWVVNCTLGATVGGLQVMEGTDYTFDFDPESLTHGLVTPLTTWDVAVDITFTARTVVITNELDGTPDTTLGFTPLMIDGLQPGYVRATIASPYERVEMVERAIEVKIDTNYPAGTSYVYP
jgi:hypothetical protein